MPHSTANGSGAGGSDASGARFSGGRPFGYRDPQDAGGNLVLAS